ncbi:MAG: hypothetical protein LBK00_00700 [Treponema sp.]|nr:hypothetical protein [Treponema sp.]
MSVRDAMGVRHGVNGLLRTALLELGFPVKAGRGQTQQEAATKEAPVDTIKTPY